MCGIWERCWLELLDSTIVEQDVIKVHPNVEKWFFARALVLSN